MKIEIRLFATLRENRGKKVFLEVDNNTTVSSIVKSLAIKQEDIAILLKNGKDTDLDIILVDGDILSIFPPVGGG